ncbi:hypothetical protein ACFYZN_27400 [Streptomyces sp. NPDC001777]|uniref:hypothetical protein n=1 Tax=Streptomyces sp. NPDC001777 TaxID=3364608 RepID=UPI0036CD1755
MKQLLIHRVAPVLLLLQAACFGFFGLLLTGWDTDTAELDHTEPSAGTGLLFTGLLLVVALPAVGGAALPGRETVRARVPGRVRAAWLGALGIAELAVAAAFVGMALQEPVGSDSPVVVVAVTACAAIAAVCAAEVRGGASRAPQPSPHI